MIEIHFKSKEGKILDLFCVDKWEDAYKVIEQYVDINPDKVNEVIIKKK